MGYRPLKIFQRNIFCMWSKEVDELKARFIVLKICWNLQEIDRRVGKGVFASSLSFCNFEFLMSMFRLAEVGVFPLFKKNVQTCSPSCNWNSTKIDKILFLLFLDIKLHMYDITVIYIQKKMNLFWGLQVGLCSTPIAYKAGHAYIIFCLLLFIARYFNFNVEKAMLQRTKCKLVVPFI